MMEAKKKKEGPNKNSHHRQAKRGRNLRRESNAMKGEERSLSTTTLKKGGNSSKTRAWLSKEKKSGRSYCLEGGGVDHSIGGGELERDIRG